MSKPLLSTNGLTKRFAGLTAVNQMNLTVMPGEFHGLIGPNGSGKTTLLNLLSGVLPPSEGEIWFQGRNLAGLPSHQIAAVGIARTFQNLKIFKGMSVLENVVTGLHRHVGYGLLDLFTFRYAAKERVLRSKAMDLLEFVGLTDKAAISAGGLSYGDQRKVEVARALAAQPTLLLLDEPLAGMNLSEGDQMLEIFRAIRKQGITVIMVEHTMRVVVQICNPLTVLNFGKKIAHGAPDDVRQNEEVIRAYLGTGVKINRAKRTGT